MEVPARIRRVPCLAALLALLALALAPAAPSAAASTPSCRGADAIPTAATLHRVRAATMCLVNRERRRRGLRRLRTNRTLQASASAYAREMVRRSFFDHVTPSGETFAERIREQTRYLAGTLRWEIGENLAWGTGASATPREIVASWMHSAGHRRNILHAAFREMGLGVAVGAPVHVATASRAATYANHFGRRG